MTRDAPLTHLLSFGFLLKGVGQRLLLRLQRGFGKQVLELVGVDNVRLLQRPPQCVVAAKRREVGTRGLTSVFSINLYVKTHGDNGSRWLNKWCGSICGSLFDVYSNCPLVFVFSILPSDKNLGSKR